jgi:DNA polymerase-3 subunit epsilon
MPDFVALDVETANSFMGSICQIGAVKFRAGQPVEVFSTLVNPNDWFDDFNTSIHGIDERMVVDAPTFAQVFPALADFIAGDPVVHHTHFDRTSIRQACASCGAADPAFRWLDSAKVTRRTWPEHAQRGYGLAPLAERLGIAFRHHDAAEDARAAGMILCAAIATSGLSIDDWFVRADQPITDTSHRAYLRTGSGAGPLVGESVVFTGTLAQPRRACADRAAALGADVADTLTRKTTMLVLGDQDLRRIGAKGKSSKHLKAEQLIREGFPIRIVAEQDFMAF